MPAFNDLSGRRFGRLVALRSVGNNRHNQLQYECVCDCGRTTIVIGSNLRGSTTKSCGCLWKRHGLSKSPTHRIWCAMRERCRDPNNISYKNYGGRGIGVCERWEKFENFLEDMGERPSQKHSIDRIDNDLGYFPDNCRWATRSEQAGNRRPRTLCKRGHPFSNENTIIKPNGRRACRTCTREYKRERMRQAMRDPDFRVRKYARDRASYYRKKARLRQEAPA